MSRRIVETAEVDIRPMPTERRREQIEQLLREEISRVLVRDLEFPKGTMVTVTHIAMSRDGHYAHAYVTLLGTDPKGALAMLRKNIYHIQKTINRKMQIRPVPKISFKIDEEEYNRERVERSIAGLKRKGEL